MITRDPSGVERHPELGDLCDGLGAAQDLFGLTDTAAGGVGQGFLGERRHRRQPSSDGDFAAFDPRLQPPQLTNRSLQHDPIGTPGINHRHPPDQLVHLSQLHPPTMTKGCDTVLSEHQPFVR